MKRIINIIFILTWNIVFSQVGINTNNPQRLFHIDGKSSASTINPESGIPSIDQQIDDVVVTNEGKLGIGTINPQEKLDINGSLKILDTEYLQSNQISELYSDENGLVGKYNIKKKSKIAIYSSRDQINVPNISLFNQGLRYGGEFVIPIVSNHASSINTINTTVPNTGNVKISENGKYFISGSIAPVLSFGNVDESEFFWIAFNIQLSKNGGNSWEAITGGRPIYKVRPNSSVEVSYVIPQVIVELNSGDLLRFMFYRTHFLSGNYSIQGVPVSNFYLKSSYRAASYLLNINKL